MEAQATTSSETHLDFAFFPDVPFLRVLNYLSGTEIERCRGISRLFRKRIDMNRKSLPSVQVHALTIDQKKFDHELPARDHSESESIIFITIQKDREEYGAKYGAALLKKALERFDHMLPRMYIESLHLLLEYFDDSTFHQLLEKFKALRIKCQNFLVVTPGQMFSLDDLRPMILQLEPKNLSLEVRGEGTLLTSAFWHEKFIRDCSELLVVASSNGFFDDQVLLNLTQSRAIINFDNACTFDGIVSFLKEWKAGGREVKCIRLLGVLATGLDTNAFLAMLPWNVERVSANEINRWSDYNYSTEIANSLGKKVKLSIHHYKDRGEFNFEIRDEDQTHNFNWLPGYRKDDPRFLLRYPSLLLRYTGILFESLDFQYNIF